MNSKKTPRISETEWEVMRVVWTKHPITASEIIERLAQADASWHPKTARTLLARLVKKRALDYEPQGRRYVYQPLVTERDCVAAVSASFLDRVFGGALQPMLAHFVEARRLTGKELEELKQLIDESSGAEKKGKKS
jgi:BlaI family transcriptional regulator, penicillinase repressor